MAAALNPDATEYIPTSLLPPLITHLPPYYDISTYNILHYPPSIACNPTYFFTSPHTTPLSYSCALPPTYYHKVHNYFRDVNFGDMGPDDYHGWRQIWNTPQPVVFSSYILLEPISPIPSSISTSEADHHHHQQQQAIASDDDDEDQFEEVIAELTSPSFEKKLSLATSLSPAHDRESSSSRSRNDRNKGFHGYSARSNCNRKYNNSLGSTCVKNSYNTRKSKSKLPMMYVKVKNREDDDEVEPIQQDSNKTTVMIKNIPNQFTQMLIQFLDEHCQSENEKAKLSSTDKESLSSPLSAYDFLYLPIDFCSRVNKGYAFVNFTNPAGVWKLNCFLNNYEWKVMNTKKTAIVTYATIQGKEALVNKFEVVEFDCDSDEFLPVCFVPYRDGSLTEMVKQCSVGKCRGYRKDCHRYHCYHNLLHQKKVYHMAK